MPKYNGFQVVSRPNGNFTLREYREGKLVSKIVEKGEKTFVSSFNNVNKDLNKTFLYEDSDDIYSDTFKNVSKFAEDMGVKYLSPDKPLKPISKLKLLLFERKDFYKIIKKSDGKEYIRQIKPIPLDEYSSFSEIFNHSLFRSSTSNIRILFDNLLKVRKS